MYQPALHRETRLDVMHALIAAHPFGLLITGQGGLAANGLPFHLRPNAGFGRLQAHIARANPQAATLDGQEVLVVFQGPQAYVSPGFYATKAQTGKVVPTWNYVMVQARGIARVTQDAAWLAEQLARMTEGMEAAQAAPWAVDDAPDDYIAMQKRAILGVEIDITAIEGKWKVSQNRNAADRAGVIQGLTESAPDMAALVQSFAPKEP